MTAVRTLCISNVTAMSPSRQATTSRDVTTVSACAPAESVFKLVEVRTELWIGVATGADVMPPVFPLGCARSRKNDSENFQRLAKACRRPACP